VHEDIQSASAGRSARRKTRLERGRNKTVRLYPGRREEAKTRGRREARLPGAGARGAFLWPPSLTYGHPKGAMLLSYAHRIGATMAQIKSEVLQGTLDLMVLKTLDALGPLHGYGIARRIEQISEELLQLNEGTVYASLLRLAQKGWISSKWGVSENNRRAKFYSLTKTGRKQLAHETENWERFSGVIGRVLQVESQR